MALMLSSDLILGTPQLVSYVALHIITLEEPSHRLLARSRVATTQCFAPARKAPALLVLIFRNGGRTSKHRLPAMRQAQSEM